MTRGELLNYLTEEARKYRSEALSSVKRNGHMNNLSTGDFRRLKQNQRLIQRLIDAILVDFINSVGVGQCVDYALYTKDLISSDRT